MNGHISTKHSSKLPQLDGNVSLPSSLDSSIVDYSHLDDSEPAFLPFDNPEPSYDDIFSLESFSTDNSSNFSSSSGPVDDLVSSVSSPSQVSTLPPPNRKVTAAMSLPNVMVTNHRSIFPKFNNLIDELIECKMHLGIHSEIWEVKDKDSHKDKIEEALELHGLKYISNPRRKHRGGGVAVTLCDAEDKFTLTKLSVSVPPDLEVCWCLLRVKKVSSPIKEIIVCAFYCPPRSSKKKKLIEHISTEYYKLKSAQPRSAFICGGDKNDLHVKHLLDISPSFRQIITRATHNNSILECLITDIGHLYNEPIIRPPIKPDVEGQGVPSDHSIAFATPIIDGKKPKRTCLVKTSRPLTTEAKQKLESWIQSESWLSVTKCENASDMVEEFCKLVSEKIEINCPLKSFKINNLDNEFTTPAIKELSRKKLREYTKHGNSKLYKILKKALKTKIKEEGKAFVDKQIASAGEKGNKWIRQTAALLARPGDAPSKSFVLPDHVERGLSELQSAEEIADFFSSISQEYDPLDVTSLPARVQMKLENDPCDHLTLEEHEVYSELLSAKKTCSVPGDIPVDILSEFLPEFITPITHIFNRAFSSHEWPCKFKKEFGVPIEKIPHPESEDDIRSIGLTPFLSKRMEKLLIKWIWKYIYPHINSDQLGGLPGCSIVHYIMRMMDFIFRKLDDNSNNPSAVLGVTVDFSKAFNRMSHNKIVTILSDLTIPTCALIIS